MVRVDTHTVSFTCSESGSASPRVSRSTVRFPVQTEIHRPPSLLSLPSSPVSPSPKAFRGRSVKMSFSLRATSSTLAARSLIRSQALRSVSSSAPSKYAQASKDQSSAPPAGKEPLMKTFKIYRWVSSSWRAWTGYRDLSLISPAYKRHTHDLAEPGRAQQETFPPKLHH